MYDNFEFKLESLCGFEIYSASWYLLSGASPLLCTFQSNGCRLQCCPAYQFAAYQCRLTYYDKAIVEIERRVNSVVIVLRLSQVFELLFKFGWIHGNEDLSSCHAQVLKFYLVLMRCFMDLHVLLYRLDNLMWSIRLHYLLQVWSKTGRAAIFTLYKICL